MTRVVAVASLLSEPLIGPLVSRALDRSPGDVPPSAPSGLAEPGRDPGGRLRGLRPHAARSCSPQRRSPGSSQARQLAMYLARELTTLSLAEIARAFDRDHTTVLHAIRAVAGRLEPGSETATAIHRVRLNLGTT